MQYTFTSKQIRNKRPYQEDVLVDKVLSPTLRFVGVFDGHGGSRCSSFVGAEMKKRVTKGTYRQLGHLLEEVANEWEELCRRELGISRPPRNAAERSGLERLDTYQRYDEDDWSSGTTACCVVFDTAENMMYVANVGDSQLIWKQDNRAIQYTRLHQPTTADHVPIPAFITRAKGDSRRVNGLLSVGRVIGDLSSDTWGSVSHTPDVLEVTVQGGLFRVAVGSDGVWEGTLTHANTLACRTANEVVKKAVSTGSTDNITVILIQAKAK